MKITILSLVLLLSFPAEANNLVVQVMNLGDVKKAVSNVEKKLGMKCSSLSELSLIDVVQVKNDLSQLKKKGCFSSFYDGVWCYSKSEVEALSSQELKEFEQEESVKQIEITNIERELSELSSNTRFVLNGRVECIKDTKEIYEGTGGAYTMYQTEIGISIELDQEENIIEYIIEESSDVTKSPYLG